MSDAAIDIDLDDLPRAARAALHAVLAARQVTVSEGGRRVGTLVYTPAVLDGIVHDAPVSDGPPIERPAADAPRQTLVVAAAMRLSRGVREQIAAELGPGHVVVDLKDAPPTTDVVLVHVTSPQLVAVLRGMFPAARILVTEMVDHELGVDYSGPVSRMLDAGADAYLSQRTVRDVAAVVAALQPVAGALGAGPSAPTRPVPSGRAAREVEH